MNTKVSNIILHFGSKMIICNLHSIYYCIGKKKWKKSSSIKIMNGLNSLIHMFLGEKAREALLKELRRFQNLKCSEDVLVN